MGRAVRNYSPITFLQSETRDINTSAFTKYIAPFVILLDYFRLHKLDITARQNGCNQYRFILTGKPRNSHSPLTDGKHWFLRHSKNTHNHLKVFKINITTTPEARCLKNQNERVRTAEWLHVHLRGNNYNTNITWLLAILTYAYNANGAYNADTKLYLQYLHYLIQYCLLSKA